MKKIDIKKSLHKLADKIKNDYPNSDLYFFVDNSIEMHKVMIMPFANLILLSKKLEVDIIKIMLEREGKLILSANDKQFVAKHLKNVNHSKSQL